MALQAGDVVTVPISEAVANVKTVPPNGQMVTTARDTESHCAPMRQVSVWSRIRPHSRYSFGCDRISRIFADTDQEDYCSKDGVALALSKNALLSRWRLARTSAKANGIQRS